LDKRLGGPQSQSGCCGEEKNLALPGIESWPFSPSLYRLSYPDSYKPELTLEVPAFNSYSAKPRFYVVRAVSSFMSEVTVVKKALRSSNAIKCSLQMFLDDVVKIQCQQMSRVINSKFFKIEIFYSWHFKG
jgi:hypothetical protein